jgi:PAS domain S-box-containing protein
VGVRWAKCKSGFDTGAFPHTHAEAMLRENLHDKAAQYVSGEMAEADRESFEILLAFHGELRATVEELSDVVTTVTVSRLPDLRPPPALKNRVLETLMSPREPAAPEGLVATDANGRVQWVNDAFSAMCGYSLDELKGRKPGDVLQGPETDRATVERIRAALRAGRSCRERILNYHKDGTRYRADVQITPILDDDAKPLCFVARERKLSVLTSDAAS